jgi:integrase
MTRGKMPYLQMYKGSWRVRRPIPKELQPYVNRGAYLTEKLRRDGEPKLTDRAEANRRAIPVVARFQAILDKAAGNHDILYGPLEQTVIKEPTHTYRLRDPSDPASLEIASTTMVERFVKKSDLKPVVISEPTLTYDFLIEKWATENRKGKKTRKDATTKFARFTSWLGHSDPARVTTTDLIRFKDYLVKERQAGNLADRTIKNYLIAMKSIFGYAEKNIHLDTNPMVGVHFTAAKGEERRDFTLDERRAILTAAREQQPVVKWLAWIPAFVGCRIEEIADCHTNDVEYVEGIWCIRIREDNRTEDQTLKTFGSVRTVPLHSALIAEGFLNYHASLPTGPLFPMLKLDTFGRRGGTASAKIVHFVRNVVKIKDLKIAPSHSWRHTVATMLADRDVPLHVIGGITGHRIQGAIADYLHPKIPEMKAAIEKLPTI